ncbi:MAG: hypothetical protein M3198_14410 [Actinomycetota bacterium]|nr:hypothetical protein [Actinomycetota bacterium]
MHARRIVVTLTAAALVVATAPAVDAHHRPRLYCSPSGDVCQSVTKVGGLRKLRIHTAAQYFEVFQLCVYSHRKDYEWCAPYELRQRAGGTWGRSVAWFKQWPSMRHRGAFTVSWWDGDTRIGRKLGLHRR